MKTRFSPRVLTHLLLCTLFVITLIGATAGDGAAAVNKSVVKEVIYDWDTHTIKIYVAPAQKGVRPEYKYGFHNGNKIYINFLNSTISNVLDASVTKGIVRRVQRVHYQGGIGRVTLTLTKKVEPKLTWHDGPNPYYLVDISGGTYDPSAAVSASSSSSSSGEKFRILIDPGHGGIDHGTSGKNGISEKAVTLDIAKLLADKLESRDDVEVKMTRTTDKFVSLSARKSLAKTWKADLFISIHANGASSTHLNQTEIYYHDSKSYKLAKLIKNDLVAELKSRDGGVRKKSYAVIKKNPATYGSILVEPYYLTSRDGMLNLGSRVYKNKIAESLSNSIDKYLEEHRNGSN